MGLRYNPFTGSFDLTRSPGSYLDGEVATYGDLPLDTAAAPLNSAWLVRAGSGLWLLTRKPAGIYIRTATGGTDRDADYTYAGTFPDVFSDANFVVYNDADSTKNVKLDASAITTGTTRTLTVPNASGTLPLLETANIFSANQTLNGTNNVAPNQTAASGSSLLTRDLGDARHPLRGTLGATSLSKFYYTDLMNTGSSSVMGVLGFEGGPATFQPSSATEPLGFWRGTTPTNINDKARAIMRGTNTLNQGVFWTATFSGTLAMRFRLGQTTDCQFVVGLYQPAAAGAGSLTDKSGAYLRYDSATDTNFMYQNGTTAANAVSSGIAVDTNWHVLKLRYVSSTSVFYALDSGAETEVTVSTGSGSIAPAFVVMTTAAAAKTADFSVVQMEINV